MNRDIEDIVLDKLLSKQVSKEEEKLFDTWFASNKNVYFEFLKINDSIILNNTNVDISSSWRKIQDIIKENSSNKNCNNNKSKKHRANLSLFKPLYKYAALIIFFIGISALFFVFHNTNNLKFADSISNNSNQKAILTLADGTSIQIDDKSTNILENELKVEIDKEDSTKMLIYTSKEETKEIKYNTIQIPKGLEYILKLSDGTKVYLNSDTKLVYPIGFKKDKREVILVGEAFFDVAKDTSKPFIVHAGSFDVEVTGTKFNVKNYKDEIASTTLASGSVFLRKDGKISHLLPGQQAKLIKDKLEIKDIILEDAIAWRYNLFNFNNEKLSNVINEVARHYNLSAFYTNPYVKEIKFTAQFRRNSSIKEIIYILEKTREIKIELKGKTLTIGKY